MMELEMFEVFPSNFHVQKAFIDTITSPYCPFLTPIHTIFEIFK
jgi:hypothetical protein